VLYREGTLYVAIILNLPFSELAADSNVALELAPTGMIRDRIFVYQCSWWAMLQAYL
jgi:hypothetical protein